jgi:hypothetical protein
MPQQPYNVIAPFAFPDGSIMKSALFADHPDMNIQDLQDGDIIAYSLPQRKWTNLKPSQASSVDGGAF